MTCFALLITMTLAGAAQGCVLGGWAGAKRPPSPQTTLAARDMGRRQFHHIAVTMPLGYNRS
jgi:hypothetical protein